MPYRCCVADCNNTSDKHPSRGSKYYEGKFIKMPDETKKRNEWNAALNLTGNAKKYVCSEHFLENVWRLQDVIMNVPLAKRKLKSDAKPVILNNLAAANNMSKVHISAAAEELSELQVRKRCTEAILETSRKQLVAEALAEYEEKLQEELAIQPQLKNAKTRKKQRRNIKAITIKPTEEGLCATTQNTIAPETAAPADELEMPGTNCKFSTSQTQKCGEIIVDINEHTFGLNCFLCTLTCRDLKTFIEHIKKTHTSLLNQKLQNTKSSQDVTISATVQEAEPRTNCAPVIVTDAKALKSHSLIANDNTHNFNALFDNRAFINFVIVHFKQKSILWNKSHELHQKFSQRKNAIVEILSALVQEFPTMHNFTYKDLSNILQRLRLAYSSERRQWKLAQEHNMAYKVKYWFYDSLQFLEHAQVNANLAYEQKLAHFEQLALKAPCDLNDAAKGSVMLDVIELYEQTTNLWHINDINYKGKLQNIESIEKLQKIIDEKFDGACEIIKSTTQLTDLLSRLNNWFSAEEHRRQLQVFKHDGVNKHFESFHPRLYKSLEFLQGHVAPFRCDICAKLYESEQSYTKHLRSKTTRCASTLNSIVHKCPHCDKRFAKAPNLRRHIRLHTNERPYQCKQCGKRFRNYSTWFRHGRTHTRHKPYKCTECERCYYTNGLLRLHQKSHLGIRDKICDICGKTFTSAKYLYRHRNVHLQVGKFKCEHCERAFKTSTTLQLHRKRCLIATDKKARQHQANAITTVSRVQPQTLHQSNQVKTIVEVERSIFATNIHLQCGAVFTRNSSS